MKLTNIFSNSNITGSDGESNYIRRTLWNYNSIHYCSQKSIEFQGLSKISSVSSKSTHNTNINIDVYGSSININRNIKKKNLSNF